ncbi:TIGR03862 family flavoprotein [Rubellicoccus peritrichatus]|uniref:TIGR03862 family flavoprotein n=1 Tax=Rubellicoccus peritrichatus TaxID=3080537 RepID=A0AAQ3LDV6_9BACT|nr:TIGR03862 family flavoprotein [Puniceicoccus sp. CR14]WOO43676.1 TIGR03862 family flavoprotein [Puniceicoccus sp. CR14]
MKHDWQKSVAVVGGGPAGLRAAEVAAAADAQVTLYDAKPSVGRKFLVAGKSGLNLTNAAEFETFMQRYSGSNMPVKLWRKYIADFDNVALRTWAESLGVETFVASNGKVFPKTKKAAPLLRHWVSRLRELGVVFNMNHRWVALRHGPEIEIDFLHHDQLVSQKYDAVVLALGGASWPQTGSDGNWVDILRQQDITIQPLQSANCGWECDWAPATLASAEGQPLQNLKVRVGDQLETGELVVTRYGFEGPPLYALGRQLRTMDLPAIEIDFKPTFTIERLVQKMESARRNFFKEARLRWKLPEPACAIIEQFYGTFDSAEELANATKCCRIPLTRARPVAEAISTSGGVSWLALNESLMFKQLPGVYCAGEMIDWEAPTGGYLMQGCFATGSIAGKAATSVYSES